MIKGVMFLGTPHLGTSVTAWTRTIKSISQLPRLETLRTDLLKDIPAKSKTMGTICEEFVEHSESLHVVTVCETKIIPGLRSLVSVLRNMHTLPWLT